MFRFVGIFFVVSIFSHNILQGQVIKTSVAIEAPSVCDPLSRFNRSNYLTCKKLLKEFKINKCEYCLPEISWLDQYDQFSEQLKKDDDWLVPPNPEIEWSESDLEEIKARFKKRYIDSLKNKSGDRQQLLKEAGLIETHKFLNHIDESDDSKNFLRIYDNKLEPETLLKLIDNLLIKPVKIKACNIKVLDEGKIQFNDKTYSRIINSTAEPVKKIKKSNDKIIYSPCNPLSSTNSPNYSMCLSIVRNLQLQNCKYCLPGITWPNGFNHEFKHQNEKKYITPPSNPLEKWPKEYLNDIQAKFKERLTQFLKDKEGEKELLIYEFGIKESYEYLNDIAQSHGKKNLVPEYEEFETNPDFYMEIIHTNVAGKTSEEQKSNKEIPCEVTMLDDEKIKFQRSIYVLEKSLEDVSASEEESNIPETAQDNSDRSTPSDKSLPSPSSSQVNGVEVINR